MKLGTDVDLDHSNFFGYAATLKNGCNGQGGPSSERPAKILENFAGLGVNK